MELLGALVQLQSDDAALGQVGDQEPVALLVLPSIWEEKVRTTYTRNIVYWNLVPGPSALVYARSIATQSAL